MKREHIPGLALAVVKDGKILKVRAYGLADVKSKIPATTNTVFRIGSISKQFVATAIMMLVEENKLRLDDPVSKYLNGTPSEWKDITIRHLLTHTSGIPDWLNENISVHTWRYGFDQRLLKVLARLPVHFAPGDEWHYSNSNYHLLGMIIHKVTGRPYGDFLRERIFQPLGMMRTAVSPMEGTVPDLAEGYDWDNNRLRPGYYVPPPVKLYAGGSILSAVADMAKWDAALYTEKLLKQSSRQQMWTPVRLNNGMTWTYGFGWTVVTLINDRLIASHGGNSLSGFSSAIRRAVDDRFTVIILDNRFNSSETVEALSSKISRIYLWRGSDYQPVPDKEPEITTRVRDILDCGDRGQLRAADFTATTWAKISPWQKQIQQDTATYGRALSLVLVDRAAEGGKRSYRYRVRYKFGTLLLHVVFDEQDKIAVWTTEDVDLN